MDRFKAKVRRSMDGNSRYHQESQERVPDYESNKPLPSDKALPTPPGYQASASKPTIRQVNAYGPDDNRANNYSMRNPTGDEPRQQLLPELDFNRLNIDDSDDLVDEWHDAHDGSPSKSYRRHGKKASNRFSQPPPVDVLKQDPSAISSAIPDRRSSKRFSGEHSGSPVNSYSPTHETEAPVTRRPLSAEAKANLPAEFQLGNTVDTTVEITEAPAVTHEVVHRQKTEIIHEVITRDIHVDHFHTSIQPIKEIIVKPAVHYTINEQGEKVRIDTPDCWEPPTGFTPTAEPNKPLPMATTSIKTYIQPYER